MIMLTLKTIRRRTAAALATCVLALGSQPVEAQGQEPVRVSRPVLERYAGEYSQNGSTFKVVVRGDTLFRETSGQRVVFVPISETTFRIGPVFTAEFVIDAVGNVTQVVSDGIDIEYRLSRTNNRAVSAPAEPVDTVRVPRSVLERYVGTYEFIAGQMNRTDLRVKVHLRGDTLIRTMSGEQVLIPLSETRFRVGNTRLVTEFVVDDAGVTQVMGAGFQQLLARRQRTR